MLYQRTSTIKLIHKILSLHYKFYLAFSTTGTGKTVQQYKGRDCLKNRCLDGFNDIKKLCRPKTKIAYRFHSEAKPMLMIITFDHTTFREHLPKEVKKLHYFLHIFFFQYFNEQKCRRNWRKMLGSKLHIFRNTARK